MKMIPSIHSESFIPENISYCDDCISWNVSEVHSCRSVNEIFNEYCVREIFNEFSGLISIRSFFICLGIVAIIITFGFYLLYKYKKDENPFLHAINRSWPWWVIVLFLIPIIVYIVMFIR